MPFKAANDEEMKAYLSSPDMVGYLKNEGVSWDKEQIDKFIDNFDSEFGSFTGAYESKDLDGNFKLIALRVYPGQEGKGQQGF